MQGIEELMAHARSLQKEGRTRGPGRQHGSGDLASLQPPDAGVGGMGKPVPEDTGGLGVKVDAVGARKVCPIGRALAGDQRTSMPQSRAMSYTSGSWGGVWSSNGTISISVVHHHDKFGQRGVGPKVRQPIRAETTPGRVILDRARGLLPGRPFLA